MAPTYTITTLTDTYTIQAHNDASAKRIARKAMGDRDYDLRAHDGRILHTTAPRIEGPCAGLD